MSASVDEPGTVAGEYVLGVLDWAEMRRVEAQAVADPGLAADIAQWEDRLGPLATLIAPVTPPPQLWARLALATGIGGAPAARRPARAWGWPAATAVTTAIAAGFAFIAFLPRPPIPGVNPAQFVAALAPLNAPAPFLAEARADGSIAITRLTNTTAPAGRDYQLWELVKGATRPVSLGVLAPGASLVRPPDRPLADTQLLVSDEPAGGSPTGQPTGAVLFGGALAQVAPAAATAP